MIHRHQEELKLLHQKLDVTSDTSLDRFRQTALVHKLRPVHTKDSRRKTPSSELSPLTTNSRKLLSLPQQRVQ